MLYFRMKKQPSTMTLILWAVVGMVETTVVDAQSCSANPQSSTCQRACKCVCDEYWNTDTFCPDICDEINNGSPVDAFPWCSNYNVADDCDQYGSNWYDSTIQSNLNIKYMRAYGHDFKLNFFTDTARDDELLPLAIVIHGGGFNSGSKDNCKIIESAREFASRGYRTIAINYPLCGAYWNGADVSEDVAPFGSGPWHAWDAEEPLYPLGIGQQHPQCEKGAASRQAHPEQYKQAQEVANRAARYAIQFSHSRAEEWGIDVERTICNGASAGAVTCYEMFLFNTTVSFRPENTGLEPEPDLDEIKINVAAGRAGGLSIPPEVRAVTDETVAAMAPGAAVYDLHGDEDEVVDISRAEFLVETMEEFGIPAELDIVTGGGHSLFSYQFNKSHPERLNAMFDFIENYLPDSVGEDDDDDDVDNDSFWNYTDVQYGTEDPSMQLMNIVLPSSGEYGVIMFHHPKGSTYNDISQREVNAALDSGYALVSWESFGAFGTVDLEVAWRYAQTCFEFLRSSSDQYGWESENIIIAGRSMGSIVSWKLAHSQDPAIIGIYTYNALPKQTWQAPDLWYPPDDVVSPAPPTYMVYGPGPNSDDGHNPVNAYPVKDKYLELGEEDKLTFIEGMWDDPALYNGKWINKYATFHYLPDLVAQIEGGTPSPIVITPTPIVTPSMVPAPTGVVVGHPYEPFTHGANGLFIGHSFFIPVARQFDDYVTSAQSQETALFPQHGFETEFSGGPSGSPGQLWDDVGHRTAINATLSSGTIDLFGMTTFDGDEGQDIQTVLDTFLETGTYPSAEEYIPDYTQWVDLALSYNPSTVIFLGWHWKTYNHLYTAEQFKTYDEFLCNFFYNSVVLELRRLYPDTQFVYICYGSVASTMRQMFEDGNLPDIENQVGQKSTSLFTDANRGHAGDMMLDMMGFLWVQILYGLPSRFLNQYINRGTPWNKSNVRDIITEGLEFNEGYNLIDTTQSDQNSSPPTNAPTTIQPSQQPSIAISSSPSMVPTTTNPTNSSAPALGIGLCFPSESIVQVIRTEGNKKSKVSIPMEQLQIDDFVMTVGIKSSPSYERVYSFGHYDPNLPKVEYLRFLPSGLELSPNHYVYRSGKFVPAREIEVGDDLLSIKTTRKQEKVTGIKHVYRRGALAPLTTSGTIVVNGVLASSYASFWNDDELSLLPSWIENQFHEWAHFVTIILRCNSWVVGKQEQQNIGLSTSTDHLRKMIIWFFQQSTIVQLLLATCLIPLLGLMYSLEQIYNYFAASGWSSFLYIILFYTMTKKFAREKK